MLCAGIRLWMKNLFSNVLIRLTTTEFCRNTILDSSGGDSEFRRIQWEGTVQDLETFFHLNYKQCWEWFVCSVIVTAFVIYVQNSHPCWKRWCNLLAVICASLVSRGCVCVKNPSKSSCFWCLVHINNQAHSFVKAFNSRCANYWTWKESFNAMVCYDLVKEGKKI